VPPPRVVGHVPALSATELQIPISSSLNVNLFEADLPSQGKFVDEALDDNTARGSAAEDPYGTVLWPAAQVVASWLVEKLEATDGPNAIIELGAGTGCVSVAAAACGADVVATDYREEPLRLVRSSAQRTARLLDRRLSLTTEQFDIKDEGRSLSELLEDHPSMQGKALHVCAADLLYMQSTSIALAVRCVEALRLPMVESVVVGDLGRPGRPAFIEALKRHGVRGDRACFQEVRGYGAPALRHDLISSSSPASGEDAALPIAVGLLTLSKEDLNTS